MNRRAFLTDRIASAAISFWLFTTTLYSGAVLWLSLFRSSAAPADPFYFEGESGPVALAAASGVLSASIQTLLALYGYLGAGRFRREWFPYYIARPLLGGITAIGFYIAVRALLIEPDATADLIDPFGLVVVSSAAGLLSNRLFESTESRFDQMLARRTDTRRIDSGDSGRPKTLIRGALHLALEVKPSGEGMMFLTPSLRSVDGPTESNTFSFTVESDSSQTSYRELEVEVRRKYSTISPTTIALDLLAGSEQEAGSFRVRSESLDFDEDFTIELRCGGRVIDLFSISPRRLLESESSVIDLREESADTSTTLSDEASDS